MYLFLIFPATKLFIQWHPRKCLYSLNEKIQKKKHLKKARLTSSVNGVTSKSAPKLSKFNEGFLYDFEEIFHDATTV